MLPPTQNVAQISIERRSDVRIPGLDALRGIAAIGVAVGHYGLYLGARPLGSILDPIYSGYPYFVELFFILSGFLLTKVYNPDTPFRVLLVRRISRLFPLHWLTLVIVALEQLLFVAYFGRSFGYSQNDWWNFGLNVLLLQQSGLQHGFSFNGPSWSISAEWLVNLLFFYLLSRRRLLPLGAAAIVVASYLIMVNTQTKLPTFGLAFGLIDVGLLRASFGFFIGVLLARADAQIRRPATGSAAWDVISCASAAILFTFLASSALNAELGVQFAAVGAFMPLLVLACSRAPRIGKLLSARPLTWLGDISYAVYLIHFPLMLAVRGFRQYFPLPLNSGEGLVLFVVIVCGLAHVAYFYFEKPAQVVLRRALSTSRAQAADRAQ